jgi:GTP cyclohydrolase I
VTPAQHLDAALRGLGLDDPACAGTGERWAALLAEFVPPAQLPELPCFPAPSRDRVVLRGLPFHSLCAHHLLPFFGEADVGYAPDGRIAGLGGIARALRHFARRPQLQERLGAELADFLHRELGAPVTVRLRARQLCMEMRGAESPGTVETLAERGGGVPL